MAKRPITPAYILFYILFLPDSWRILAGLAVAALLTPFAARPDMAAAGQAMVFLMLGATGYAASGGPARWITRRLKRWILGDRYKT